MSAASVASYVAGQCTAYVAQVLNWVPAGLGNAQDWLANAAKAGLPESSTPQAGAVVVYKPGSFPATSDTPAGYYDAGTGHVAVVTAVNADGTFKVSEMNYSNGPGKTDTRESSMADVEGFILPPGSAGEIGTLSATQPAGQPTAATTTGIDLNPLDWVGDALSGLENLFENVILRLMLGLAGATFILVGLYVLAKGTGHDVNVSMPGGGAAAAPRAAGEAKAGGAEGAAEEAAEVAA
jgi:hypothetical protein